MEWIADGWQNKTITERKFVPYWNEWISLIKLNSLRMTTIDLTLTHGKKNERLTFGRYFFLAAIFWAKKKKNARKWLICHSLLFISFSPKFFYEISSLNFSKRSKWFLFLWNIIIMKFVNAKLKGFISNFERIQVFFFRVPTKTVLPSKGHSTHA